MQNVPVPLLDFTREYPKLREDLLSAITRVCDSQRFVLGPAVEEFESEAATALQVPHALGCSSGTDALWLAIAGSGIVPGDEVITTPFSFFASASSIIRAGATPVFADIDPVTFNLSVDAVEAAVTPRTRAVLPVHLYGQPADWDAFTALARRHNLLLIEDAAQAWGARWRGRPAGSLGHAAAFSFYPTKNLSAMGDAGLVSTNSSEVAQRVRSLRGHGMMRRYFHEEVGWNCRLDSIQAAILSVKLRYVEAGNAERGQLAATYDRLFQQAGLAAPSTSEGIVLPVAHPDAYSVWHQYVIRAPRRDDLRAALTSRQIGTEVYYPLPLHRQAALQYLGYSEGDFPFTETAAHEVLALPIFPGLREDEQQIVVDAIASFYRQG